MCDSERHRLGLEFDPDGLVEDRAEIILIAHKLTDGGDGADIVLSSPAFFNGTRDLSYLPFFKKRKQVFYSAIPVKTSSSTRLIPNVQQMSKNGSRLPGQSNLHRRVASRKI